ncbi:ABC transporter permease [Paenibacillus azoreducens]|nr:ABC transporter permease [Paenibacillus azoreducens]
MIGKALSSDFLKIRKKGVWFLVFLGSVGLLAMQALNFGLRYDYMIDHYKTDLWLGLIREIFSFVPIALYLGCTLIASLIANVEHQNNSWKQLLALPISRVSVFTAKVLLAFIAMGVACLILSAGTVILGILLGFGTDNIPYLTILKLSFLPYLGALPMLALQLWMSLTLKNQALPITLGITAAIASMFSASYPEFVPLSWPFLSFVSEVKPELPIGAGIILAFIVYMVGMGHFRRKDVN